MFTPARNYTRRDSGRPVSLIVLHSMESQEKPGTAMAVATWFGSENAPRASAHFCVDSAEVVQCVRVQDIAWHAPGANHNGIGIELAGRAAQTREEWMDSFGRPMLELAARLTASLCTRFHISTIFRDSSALRSGAGGITTHAAVTKAFERSTHTDPGARFPIDWYVSRVATLMSEMDPLSARSSIDVPI